MGERPREAYRRPVVRTPGVAGMGELCRSPRYGLAPAVLLPVTRSRAQLSLANTEARGGGLAQGLFSIFPIVPRVFGDLGTFGLGYPRALNPSAPVGELPLIRLGWRRHPSVSAAGLLSLPAQRSVSQ